MYLVLRPGGRALVLDLRRDTDSASVRQAVNRMGLTPVNRLITRWTFEHMLLKRAFSRQEILELAAKSRFPRCEAPDHPLELEVRLEK
jgi:hypothetical protein